MLIHSSLLSWTVIQVLISASQTMTHTIQSEAYIAHESDKYWPENLCPFLGTRVNGSQGYAYNASLETCKRDCSINDDCTAIHYNDESSWCVLKKCPIPAPEPIGYAEGWTGYSIEPAYIAHESDKYWLILQCPFVGARFNDSQGYSYNASLETCKRDCAINYDCTAIHYNEEESKCVLKKCPIPAPEPVGTDEGWIGYSVEPAYIAHESDKYWPENLCPFVGTRVNGSQGYAYNASLETCKRDCSINDDCTAIHYNDESSWCVLKKCPIPAPEPVGDDEGWIGYSVLPVPLSYTTEGTPTELPPTELPTTTTPGFQECGGDYTSSSGMIMHPPSFGSYQNNENCVWHIMNGQPFNITFLSFDIENNYDYLIISDGNSIDSHVLGKFTGPDLPNPVEVKSGAASIVFTSDHSDTKTGFILEWQTSESPAPTPITEIATMKPKQPTEVTFTQTSKPEPAVGSEQTTQESVSCIDMSPNCPRNAFQCDTNTFVQTRCQKTCNLCHD